MRLSDTSETERGRVSTDSSHFTSTEDEMLSATLTRADIVEALYREIGLSKGESGDLLESMIGHITKSLVAGETVKLAGFGVFSTRQKTARPGRNPKTGQSSKIKARRVLLFKPSPKMKNRVRLKRQR